MCTPGANCGYWDVSGCIPYIVTYPVPIVLYYVFQGCSVTLAHRDW